MISSKLAVATEVWSDSTGLYIIGCWLHHPANGIPNQSNDSPNQSCISIFRKVFTYVRDFSVVIF